MNKIQRLTLSFALTLALLAIPTLLAAAKELGALTISGPGIQGEVTLNDPGVMANLQQSGFFDTSSFIKPPANLGQGYNLTAYLNLDSKVVPFIQMVYYPAAKGQAGYMHWTGRLNGDTMQLNPADEWSTVSAKVGTAFSELMATKKIALQVAVPAVPSTSSGQALANVPAVKPASVANAPAVPSTDGHAAGQPSSLLLALIGAGFVLAAGALIWRRRVLIGRGASGD